MSLINKMLRDLESRQPDATAAPATRPVYQDLRAAKHSRVRAQAPLLMGVAAIVVIVAGGFYAWNKSGQSVTATANPVVATPAIVAPMARTPAASDSPVPAPVIALPAADTAVPVVATPVAARPVQPAAPVSEPVATANPVPVTTVLPAPQNKETNESLVAPAAPVVQKPAVSRKAAKSKSTAVAVAEAVHAEGSVDKRIRPFTPDEKAESAYRTAVRYVDEGRNDDAVRELTDALRASPQHIRARELLVGLALKNGRRREAQQLLEEGMVQSPKHHTFAQLLARVHIDQGADQKALMLLQSAAPLAPNDPDFATLLATVYQRVGRHADAVATFSRVTELRPGDARAWLGLAISLEAEQKPKTARRAYERAQQLSGLPPSLAKYAEKRLAVLRAE